MSREKVCIDDVVRGKPGGGAALRVALGLESASDDEIRASSRVVLAVHAYNDAIDRERAARAAELREQGFIVHERKRDR